MQARGPVAIVTTDGGAADRSALAAVRALGAAGRRVVVASSGRRSLAAASRFASRSFAVAQPDDPDYPASIRRLEEAHDAVAVFATSDRALVALQPDTAQIVDKRRLELRAQEAGLSMPPTIEFATARELEVAVAEHIGFPVVVKPHVKVPGGPTATRVDSREQLTDIGFTAGLAQPFSTEPMRALAGVVWQGELVASVQQRYVRTFPAAAGTASFAITCPEDEETFDQIRRMLHGFDGVFQAQFVGRQLIDLNARPYGSMPLATAAGVNLPDIVCRLTAGEAVPRCHASHGVRYRWIDGDYRSIASALRSGRITWRGALIAAAPGRGTTHSVASWSDPRPFAVRLGRLLARAS